jgi:hypothetical protein
VTEDVEEEEADEKEEKDEEQDGTKVEVGDVGVLHK